MRDRHPLALEKASGERPLSRLIQFRRGLSQLPQFPPELGASPQLPPRWFPVTVAREAAEVEGVDAHSGQQLSSLCLAALALQLITQPMHDI